MAIDKVLTAEQQKLHEELYSRFVAATAHAGEMLKQHGLTSKEFREADHAAGTISYEIQKLIGRHSWLG
ncbi:MAG: hypothetical protein IR164_14130 [Devosia sp.]|uniref:hypothetical protein n=1 Tax=Devosia sp. TaxID=1871048 RepID=UPI0019EA614D|nr:hypothetical protein [Devosia sp.]MBF0680068.1 hypothetical protein [Devosia sp.]